jgi:hypothetical protein
VYDRSVLPFLVAVETDPLRYHGEGAVQPGPLESAAAEQLLAHIAADLTRLFPAAAQFNLCLSGALYDQAQVLRPGWPLFAAMNKVSARRRRKADDAPCMLSIGASAGHMPTAALTPDPALPPGILQLLPLQLSGEQDAIGALEEQMEHRFMEEGQLSAHSARALENAFNIASTHVRFLTLTDLQAMLKMQLEHFGFGVLWALLDAALESAPDSGWLTGNGGQQFRWDGECVIARFETFDYWAREGGGNKLEDSVLGEAYSDWTREYRQVLVTLGAHGVTVHQQLPASADLLEGLYYVEDAGASGDAVPAITEHGGEALGTLAVTVVHEGRMSHYYPLAPEGSNALHAHLATLGVAHRGLSFPGSVCFERDRRRLTADCA